MHVIILRKLKRLLLQNKKSKFKTIFNKLFQNKNVLKKNNEIIMRNNIMKNALRYL